VRLVKNYMFVYITLLTTHKNSKSNSLAMKQNIVSLLLASSVFVNAQSASNGTAQTNQTMQILTGYQKKCIHDAAIAFDDGPYIHETELVNSMVSYGALSTLFVNGFNYVIKFSVLSSTLTYSHFF
jgi:hypothetical protein